jgi:hypothetical protein
VRAVDAMSIARRRVVVRLALLLAALPAAAAATDRPILIIEAPGVTVQAGSKVAIYAFPPSGRVQAPWPYPYPPYPTVHPAFPAPPFYPSYGVPAPYVPLGSPYAPPPVEIRGMELKPGGRLVIEVEPRDADVYVDGMRLTTRGQHGFEIGVLAGRHRLDVRRAGMPPWSQDVDVPAGGGLLVNVDLVPQPVR